MVVSTGETAFYRKSPTMAFDKEPDGYEKTLLSDLQGAWQNLRDTVAGQSGLAGRERVLLHIDEAMSWESVRNLRSMRRSLLLVRNLLMQGDAPEEVACWLQEVNGLLEETLRAHRAGEIP